MMASPPQPNGRDGLLMRARYTPLRDVIRLRMTGRLNIRKLVAQAKLPPLLAELVLHITRRTRLSRLEKADVARELVAHFSDGLDAGRSAEQLRADFGDADQAAKLIRRAKRRNRSAIARIPRYSAYGLGVLVVLYLILAVRFFTGSPNPSHDYLADLNSAAAAAPAELSGWPLYRSALIDLEAQPTWGKDMPTRPEMEQWEQMQGYLLRNAHVLDQVREAAGRSHMGYVAGFQIAGDDKLLWPDIASNEPETDSLIGVLLPYLGPMRQLARLLGADCFLAAEQDDTQRIVANIAAMLNMSEQLREVPTLINELVAIAVCHLAIDSAMNLMHDDPAVLDEAALVQLAHRLAGAHGGQIHVNIDAERFWFYDTMQRLYTDDGHGNGRITAEGIELLMQLGASDIDGGKLRWYSKLALPGATLLLANRREMVAKYEELMRLMESEARMPLWQRTHSVDSTLPIMEADPLQYARYAPIIILMPAISKASIQGDKVAMARDAALTMIALELYRREHGDWPPSLDQLVPAYLPTVPVDRYDGNTLRYVIRDGLPVLYSVGQNQTDDGGTVQEDFDRATRRMEGDWIVWPPAR